tara:strand:+ start:319 stop:522 length:204 start_codon:yes stop_codon:yes gene_type:complete
MNKELIQKLFSKSCWDEQAEVDIEDFISVEKFAELIVRDCALTASIMEYEGRAGIGAQLLDNFGVEE